MITYVFIHVYMENQKDYKVNIRNELETKKWCYEMKLVKEWMKQLKYE